MSMKDAYQKKLEARLDEWDAEIAKLEAQARAAEADVEIERRKEIEGLKAKREHAAARLEELRQAGDDAFNDLKAGAERAFDAMSEAVQKAVGRFS